MYELRFLNSLFLYEVRLVSECCWIVCTAFTKLFHSWQNQHTHTPTITLSSPGNGFKLQKWKRTPNLTVVVHFLLKINCRNGVREVMVALCFLSRSRIRSHWCDLPAMLFALLLNYAKLELYRLHMKMDDG